MSSRDAPMDEELQQKRDLLRNGEKFVSAIQGALWNLGGGDEGGAPPARSSAQA